MRSLWVARGAVAPFAVALAVWAGASGTRPAAAADSENLIAEVKAAWEKREAATRTVRMAWDFKKVTAKEFVGPVPNPNGKGGADRPAADATHDGKASILLEGLSARYTLSDHIWSSSDQMFTRWQYDCGFVGGVAKALNRFGSQKFPQGIVQKAPWAKDDTSLSDWTPLFAVRGARPQVMRSEALGAFTQARRTTLDGAGVIELTAPRTDDRWESKIWVAPASDYSLVRYENYGRDGELVVRVTATPQRHPSGVWLPAAWAGSAFTNQRLHSTVTATMTAVEIAPPVKPADFELTFPAGALVWDRTDDTWAQYLVKEDGQKRPILREENFGPTYEDLVRTETGGALASKPGAERDGHESEGPSQSAPAALVSKSGAEHNWLTRNGWVGGAVGVLLIAAALVVYRAARRARRGPMHSGGGTV